MNSKNQENLVTGIYETRTNDQEIVLCDNESVEVISSSSHFVGNADVIIKLFPKPRLIFKIVLPVEASLDLFFKDEDDKTMLIFPLRGVSTEIIIIDSGGTRDPDKITAVPSKEPLIIDSGNALSRLVFHLPNFYNFLGKQDIVIQEAGKSLRVGRVILSADGWIVTVNAVSNIKEIKESLTLLGGTRITHVGQLVREDNSHFSTDDANELLRALFYFFSFCRGFWSPPILPVGFSSDGEKAWEEWGTRRMSIWQSTLTWFDKHHGEMLNEVFPGFLEYWKSDTWQETIQRAIYWYVHSNIGSGGMDGSIVLVQSALEALAWVYLVEDRRSLSSDGFKKLPASDQLRLLLSSLEIPLSIPKSLRELDKLGKELNWFDGPQAFTEIRNSIVHPQKKKGLANQQKPIFEIWNLGVWYIELILLRLFKYTGTYAERLKTGRWIGDVVKVPWS